MKKAKASISKASNYLEQSDYWDNHEAVKGKTVQFKVDLSADASSIMLDQTISTKVNQVAQQRGVSAVTLINLWLQEKLFEHRLAPSSRV